MWRAFRATRCAPLRADRSESVVIGSGIYHPGSPARTLPASPDVGSLNAMTLTTEWSWLDVAAVSRLADRIDRGPACGRGPPGSRCSSQRPSRLRGMSIPPRSYARRGAARSRGSASSSPIASGSRSRRWAACGRWRRAERAASSELAERWRTLAQAAVADDAGGRSGAGRRADGGRRLRVRAQRRGRASVARVRRRIAGRSGAVARSPRAAHVADGQRRRRARR